MDNEIKNDLVKYRLEKAKEQLETAKELVQLVEEYINKNIK